jgi:hypothetical protein
LVVDDDLVFVVPDRQAQFNAPYASTVVVVSPRYFAKLIGLGGLMQVANAFAYVHNALSFIINAYNDIASWQAVTQRLGGFEDRLSQIHKSAHSSKEIVIRFEGEGITVEGLDLDLPHGRPLLRGVSFNGRGWRRGADSRSDGFWEECTLASDCWHLAFWPWTNQARRRAHSLRTTTAVSPARNVS